MPYDNSRRAAAAHAARRRVLTTARDLFLADGYSGTTIRAVADGAGVSPELVYKQFGGKAALLKGVYDVAIAGDDEPAPVADRAEARRVREAASPGAAAAAYAQMVLTLGSRVASILAVLVAARDSDPQLGELAATLDAERYSGATRVAGHWADRGWLRGGLTPGTAADVIWTLNSPEVRGLLVRRGWDEATYRSWLEAELRSGVLRARRPGTR